MKPNLQGTYTYSRAHASLEITQTEAIEQLEDIGVTITYSLEWQKENKYTLTVKEVDVRAGGDQAAKQTYPIGSKVLHEVLALTETTYRYRRTINGRSLEIKAEKTT